MATCDVERQQEPQHGIEMFEETCFNGVWNNEFLSGLVSDLDNAETVNFENLYFGMNG